MRDWIPCDKFQPDRDGTYLVTTDGRKVKMTERQEQMIYDEGRRKGFEEGKEYILKNMIVIPNNVERGSETYIGEDIVVCHHDDYIDMMLDAAQWNEYGKGKEADRPKGEWIEERNWRNASFYSVCSECGYFDDERDDLTAYNYCPNCGCAMTKE